MKTAYLLFDARGPEIQHRSGLTAPDEFIYLAAEGKKPTVFFDAREFDVQKEKLRRLKNGVAIKRLEPYQRRAAVASIGHYGPLIAILRDYGVREVKVSASLPLAVARAITADKIKVTIHDYAAERVRKTAVEVKHMVAAQHANESAFNLAWKILSQSKTRGGKIIYKKQVLTSELMKSILRKHLLDRGYDCPDGIIVASGPQAAQPHNEGTGALKPNTTIIIDIFPRSEKSGYYADMTRTFVKGRASKKILNLFAAVYQAQKQAIDNISVGSSCSEVHELVVKTFRRLGHPTSPQRGFMHSTGHSLGLAVHESPRLSSVAGQKIEAGMAVTIEPGLYYPGLGGVRLEDVVVFHPNGRKENITKFTKPAVIP